MLLFKELVKITEGDARRFIDDVLCTVLRSRGEPGVIFAPYKSGRAVYSWPLYEPYCFRHAIIHSGTLPAVFGPMAIHLRDVRSIFIVTSLYDSFSFSHLELCLLRAYLSAFLIVIVCLISFYKLYGLLIKLDNK